MYEAAQRIFGVAEFRFYAIADGIQNALFGRSHGVGCLSLQAVDTHPRSG